MSSWGQYSRSQDSTKHTQNLKNPPNPNKNETMVLALVVRIVALSKVTNSESPSDPLWQLISKLHGLDGKEIKDSRFHRSHVLELNLSWLFHKDDS